MGDNSFRSTTATPRVRYLDFPCGPRYFCTRSLYVKDEIVEVTVDWVEATLVRLCALAVLFRLSIYGRRLSEWDKLARWFFTNRLAHNNVRWLIQIPRLYHIYKKIGEVTHDELSGSSAMPSHMSPAAGPVGRSFHAAGAGEVSIDRFWARMQHHPLHGILENRMFSPCRQRISPEHPPCNRGTCYSESVRLAGNFVNIAEVFS